MTNWPAKQVMTDTDAIVGCLLHGELDHGMVAASQPCPTATVAPNCRNAGAVLERRLAHMEQSCREANNVRGPRIRNMRLCRARQTSNVRLAVPRRARRAAPRASEQRYGQPSTAAEQSQAAGRSARPMAASLPRTLGPRTAGALSGRSHGRCATAILLLLC